MPCLRALSYTRRFYEEVLSNPATASPLIFPETVFNAPASHLAAYLGSTAPNCTLVGDEGMFLQGLALAAEWLEEEEVEACVVIGVEELDWLVPDALRLFSRQAVYSSGAGALYLTRNSQGARAELAAVTDSFSMTLSQSRREAARKARAQLPPPAPGERDLIGELREVMEAVIARDSDRACRLLASHMQRSAEVLIAQMGG